MYYKVLYYIVRCDTLHFRASKHGQRSISLFSCKVEEEQQQELVLKVTDGQRRDNTVWPLLLLLLRID